MMAAIVMGLTVMVVALMFVLWMSREDAARSERQVVIVDESRWDPWGWWPAGPWAPQWHPHPFYPPAPRPEHHRRLGPGGERRLLGRAHRG